MGLVELIEDTLLMLSIPGSNPAPSLQMSLLYRVTTKLDVHIFDLRYTQESRLGYRKKNYFYFSTGGKNKEIHSVATSGKMLSFENWSVVWSNAFTNSCRNNRGFACLLFQIVDW